MGTAAENVHLFVLAHPDDEMAFAPLLSRLAGQQKAVRLIYLTDGGARGASASVRKQESLAALDYLGVPAASADFAGADLAIPDGGLHRHLDRAHRALEDWSASWRSTAGVYSFAWEGGHPDHDAALVIAAAYAGSRRLTVRQVPFYRAPDRLPPPFFTVSSVIADNGEPAALALSRRERLFPPRLLRFYRSQWPTFVGLGPFVLWRSLTRSSLALQPLSVARLFQRPTPRKLLYEHRYGLAFAEFAAAAEPFLRKHLGAGMKAPEHAACAEPA